LGRAFHRDRRLDTPDAGVRTRIRPKIRLGLPLRFRHFAGDIVSARFSALGWFHSANGSIALLVFALATFPIGIALTPWAVAAAVGDSRASPLFALRRAGGSILWGVVVEILAVLPLMVVHYGLGLGATGQAPRLAVPMLVLDTVCVGFLGIVINTSQVIVAERMMLRAGEAFEYRQP
jgi:hypothetical protein